jgi:hypothetical protein
MAPTQNGRHNGARHPSRSLRFDDVRPGLRGNDRETRQADSPVTKAPEQGHSGRRFVIVAVVFVLLTWGGLYLAFQHWRSNYRARVAYGLSNVVPVVDALKEVEPPGVDPTAWRDAVDKTRAMLTTVVGSNLLGVGDMDKLRLELHHRVAGVKSQPETALTELAGIWDEMADRAEFLFQDSRAPTQDRHVRPKVLPPRPARGNGQGTTAGKGPT